MELYLNITWMAYMWKKKCENVVQTIFGTKDTIVVGPNLEE